MTGNNVIWQPEEVEDLLFYYKEKMQELGKTLILREAHHEECAQRINQKYATNFTAKQVYYKYHKLKGEWKVILKAKSASGASFDEEQKKIIHDKIEVVKMRAVSIYASNISLDVEILFSVLTNHHFLFFFFCVNVES